MSLKRKETVVISCVAFETVKVVKPIQYIGATKVYLLHSTKSKNNAQVYKDFLDEVKRQLKENMNIEPITIDTTVYRFKPVLKELVKIMRDEIAEGNDVSINLAAGPQAFAAAGMVACMMEGATPFFVGTQDFTVQASDYYIDGKPVGIAKEVYNPAELPTFPVKAPPEDLVKALQVLKFKKENKKSTTYRKMIDELEPLGLMERDMEKEPKDKLQSDKMYYRRHYIDKWVTRKWVVEVGRKIEITPAGEMVAEVFYTK